MQILQNRSVARAARKEGVSDEFCREAIFAAEEGLIDANLGGGLIKQRIAREGQGKSGGYRSIIFYRRGELAIMLHLFAKSEKGNISAVERTALLEIASAMDTLTPAHIAALVENEGWRDISDAT